MVSPRWRKVIRDLLSHKSRTFLVTAAIAVGVFAFGGVFVTQEVLLKNIDIQYRASRASNIWLYLPDFDSSLVDWIQTRPGVGEAEGKSSQTVKLQLSDGREELLNIISVPHWPALRLNLLVPKTGNWPPGRGELVLERNSLAGSKINLGDVLEVKTPAGRIHRLVVTGTVYDNSAFPYIFTHQLGGYISWETLASLGFPKRFNQLQIITSPEIIDLAGVEKLTDDLTAVLHDRGIEVGGNFIQKPNQHWATDNSRAFTAILSVIGVFSLVLSGFLVVNTVSALLAQQRKQIGIMKAVGANRRQIIQLYLVMVASYGVLALVIALPMGMLMGYVFLAMVSNFLNLDIRTFFLPPGVFLMELGAALVVPVVAAAIPVISGAKKPVREVISDFQSVTKVSRMDKLLARITGLSLPLLISLRNVFRKKGRLALTLGTLVTAGALFMGVINVRTGMFREMDRILAMFDFEVRLNLSADAPAASIVRRLLDLPLVTAVEARTHVSAQRIKADGTKGAQFGITGLPPQTVFSHPVILSGRWLLPDDKDRIVLSSAFTRDNPGLAPGDILDFEVQNEKYHLEIVGIIAMTQNQTFSSFATVARIKDQPEVASGYLIKTSPDDAVTQRETARLAQDRLERSGINLSEKETKDEIYTAAANQFNFLIFFLLAMAVMVAVVGGLGLAGTMSLNVMERTREIGIMRSIGAGDRMIRKLVLAEGLFVGFISWLVALPVSLPLTYGFCYLLGKAFFERTLVFAVVPAGMLIWLVIIMFIATVASLLPAGRAAKMSISETLSYE